MTESFEDACASYDHCTWIGRKGVEAAISRLQKVHEREIAEALCDACDQCDRMDKKAHEHEIEQLRRSRFREGYEAGQRSMDAAHYLLKLRLQGLSFGDSSHENLNRLAYAIYPCPTGWGKESCEGLRDKLIELLGGVHDEPAPIPASRCACDADCNCSHGDETSVTYDVLGNERHKAVCELRKMPDCYTHDGKRPPAGKFNEALSDAIGVMGLPSFAKIRDRLIHLLGGGEPLPNFSEPFRTFAEPNLPKSAEIVKPESEDGGKNCRIADENLNWESFIESLVMNTEELSRQGKVKFPPNADGSLDSLKTVEETAALIDEVKRRADQSHESSPMRQENETGLTDELRAYSRESVRRDDYMGGLTFDLDRIADRIDEQFDRICWQQEAVLQQTIDTMVDERDKLRIMLTEQRDEARAKVLKLDNEVSDLLDLLRDAVVDFKNASYGWDYALIVGENITIETERNRLLKERDELQKKLDGAQDLLKKRTDERDVLQRERDEWRRGAEHEADKCKEYKGSFERYRDSYVEYVGRYNIVVREREELRKSLRMIAERIGVPHHRSFSMYGDEALAEATLDTIDSKNEHIGALKWQRDRQKKLLDEYDETHMELPVDANGESIHVGDIMEYAEGGKPKEVIAVSDTEAFLVDDGPRYSSLCVHHAKPEDDGGNVDERADTPWLM